MKVGMVGLGNMGTTIANLIAENGHEVTGWEFEASTVEEINARHINQRYLKGVSLSENLRATHRLEEAVTGKGIVFVALPSRFIASTLSPVKAHIPASTIIVNMAKGIDRITGVTSRCVLEELFPRNPVVMLSGPSIANEIACHMPTVVVIARKDNTELASVAEVLNNSYFRTCFSEDVIGTELCGILKNIYAIGLGLFDGAGITSINFRSVYLTVALDEMARFGQRRGADRESFYNIAGMGDLIATALSGHSHNRRMGELLAQGRTREDIRSIMGVLPEGYNTLQAVLAIAGRDGITMPLASAINVIADGRLDAAAFIRSFVTDTYCLCRRSN